MFAGIVTFHRRPDVIDGANHRFHEEVAPALKRQPGFQGAYVLVDRASGKQLGITLWESQEAAEAAVAAMSSTTERSSRELGDTAPPIRELFEVVAQL